MNIERKMKEAQRKLKSERKREKRESRRQHKADAPPPASPTARA